jgi:hypothetical protein
MQIASQCEELGGKGVNLARAMLATEGILFWEDPDCDTLLTPTKKAENTSKSAKESIQGKCWPNPASDVLYFDFSQGDLSGRLEIVACTGSVVASNTFGTTAAPLEINIKALSQGIYLARAELQDGSIFSWRVAVQR